MSVRVVTGGASPPQALAALTTHLHLRPRPPAAHAHRITCTTARDRPTGPDCPRRSPSRRRGRPDDRRPWPRCGTCRSRRRTSPRARCRRTRAAWRDQHAPLGVELHVLCGADVVRLEGRQLAVEALLGGDLLLEALPSRERIHVQARTSAASELGNHEALVLEPGEHLPEAGRDGDPPLVVHQVLMGAAEHSMLYRASLPYHPKAPIQHSTPRPTTIPHRPCACTQIEGRLSSEMSDRQPISPGLRPRLRPGTGRAGGTALNQDAFSAGGG